MHESKPNFPTGSISFPNFKDWKKNNHTFSDMAISRPYAFSLTGMGEPERLQARFVSSDLFTVFGVSPVLGRNLASGEDETGAAPVAMISSSLWQRKFGGTLNTMGRVLKLDDRGYTVIGVVPPTFDLLTESFRTADVYVPIGQWNNNALQYRSAGLAIHGFGRLKPGVTIERARADMASVTNALWLEYPADDKGVGAALILLKDEMVGGIRPILLTLLGAVVFVLLIACVNVANLLLARANGRTREVAIRSALGAGAGRLVRQLLTESILLALLGAGLGLAITSWGTHVALAMLPTVLPRAGEIAVDHRVLAFTIGISLLSGILFGLVPALKVMRTDLQGTLKEGARSVSGPKQRAQGLFVILEIAMALVLLAGAGLMIRSLAALWSVNPGFQSDGVLQFGLSLPPSLAKSPPEAVRAVLRETQARFAATPGVEAVSLSFGALPLEGDDEELFWLKGQPKPASESDMNWALRYAVGPDYLKVMRIALRQGRFLNNHDDNHAPLVVVVDEEFARKFFGKANPIGQRLELTDPHGEAEIVGVVAHVKQWSLDTDDKETLRAQLYLPILQQVDPVGGMDVVVRFTGSPTPVFEALRRTSAAMSSEQVIYGQETMNEVIAGTIAARRFAMILLGAFAALALALAMMGVYGVTSYSVGRRTNEIGIRMALGAKRSGVFRLVLGEGMRLAMIGTAVGIVAALAVTQWLEGLLFGVSAHDPLTLAGVAILLSSTVALATWIPARRATRVDPMVALRHE
jgi:predicted permease